MPYIGSSAFLSDVLKFAAAAHIGQTRKGSSMPYIIHPFEAALIAMSLTDDEELIAAAMLHDVIEDTKITADELKTRFGDRVVELVMNESEDKLSHLPPQSTWKQRKSATLERLRVAGYDTKLLCLCDKLSNIRQCAADKARDGDDMWNKFHNNNKADQEWYYRSIAALLTELSDTEAYREYTALLDKVF